MGGCEDGVGGGCGFLSLSCGEDEEVADRFVEEAVGVDGPAGDF